MTRPPGVSATLHPVQELLQDRRYHFKCHIFALGNWYMSITAARYNLIFVEHGIDLVGTVKTNKKHLPKLVGTDVFDQLLGYC